MENKNTAYCNANAIAHEWANRTGDTIRIVGFGDDSCPRYGCILASCLPYDGLHIAYIYKSDTEVNHG